MVLEKKSGKSQIPVPQSGGVKGSQQKQTTFDQKMEKTKEQPPPTEENDKENGAPVVAEAEKHEIDIIEQNRRNFFEKMKGGNKPKASPKAK